MPQMDDLIRAATGIKVQVGLATTALLTATSRLDDVGSQDPRLISVGDDIREALDALRNAHDDETDGETSDPGPAPVPEPPTPPPPEPMTDEQAASYHAE